MSVLAQVAQTFLVAPLAILRLRLRGAAYLVLYLSLCAALLALVGHEIITHRDDLIDALCAYVMPETWRFAARALVERMFASQVRQVLVNGSVGLSLALLSALLFPLKEKVSAEFEREARLTTPAPRGLGRVRLAIEELSLFVMFVTAQMSIFWIGYGPDPLRKQAAVVLSYVVLFSSFAVNFISPLLQRRGLRYSTIIKLLLAHPIVLFGFGALFTLPSVVAVREAGRHPEWSLPRAIAILFAANVACLAWGTIAGTWLAAKLAPVADRTRPPPFLLRAVTWLAVVALAAANVYAFGAVGLSLHRKSQLLKCRYTIDPSSIRVDVPGVGALLGSRVEIGLELDLTIENPTPYDVELEKNRLEVRHEGALLVAASLSPVRVPAHERRVEHVALPMVIDPRALVKKGRGLLEPRLWSITLFLEITPRFELPVYLLVGGGK